MKVLLASMGIPVIEPDVSSTNTISRGVMSKAAGISGGSISRLKNPESKRFTVLAIALECGFNSKSVFNDFFKKSEGMTPSAWLKKQKN